MKPATLFGQVSTAGNALFREGWWLQRDPALGFEMGVRSRLTKWRVDIRPLNSNSGRSLGEADAVHWLDDSLEGSAESLAKVSKLAWQQVRPGGWFAFTCQMSFHEAIALVTLHGWHTEQVFADLPAQGGCVLVLRRPSESFFRDVTLDWEEERRWWSKSEAKAKSPMSPAVTPLPTRRNKRRCHVFGVGIAKSGTSSLAGLFEKYRSKHEFEPAATIERISKSTSVSLTCDWDDWIKDRDRRGGLLECDSSQLHVWYLPELLKVFPEAGFVLTVRNPISWLDSLINHQLARGRAPIWAELDKMRFGSEPYDYEPGEQVLRKLALPPLTRWLQFWRKHHEAVLDSVPAERLLVLELECLSNSLERLGAFAGVDPATLSLSGSHLNEARASYRIVERLDVEFLQDRVRRETGDIWERLVRKISDTPVTAPLADRVSQ